MPAPAFGSSTFTLDGNIKVTGNISAASTLILTGSAGGEITGNITGSSTGLSVTGAGTWLLRGTNSYGGSTTISAGTLVIDRTGTLGSGAYAGTISIASGATLQYSSSSAQTLSGVISGAGSLRLNASSDATVGTSIGTLTLSNTGNSYSGGTTVYVLQSYGLTSDWLVAEPITKEESLLNIVYQPEVQSDIYIERGKNSATERAERLGEVDNLGDLVNYGYGFFKVVTQ
jgi:autotransporter-associated beta strand protein